MPIIIRLRNNCRTCAHLTLNRAPDLAPISIFTSAPPSSMCFNSASPRRASSFGLLIHLNSSGVNSIPSAPIVQKTYCQPKRWMIQPMGASSTSEKYCDALKMEEAVPRSFVGNQAATNRPLPGNVGAKENPIRNNSANSTTNASPPFRNFVKPIRNMKNDHEKNATP